MIDFGAYYLAVAAVVCVSVAVFHQKTVVWDKRWDTDYLLALEAAIVHIGSVVVAGSLGLVEHFAEVEVLVS